VAAQLVVSREGLGSMELFSKRAHCVIVKSKAVLGP
jgi:hypothetical protein